METVGAYDMFDLSHIKQDTQRHLVRVYGALTTTTAVAAAGAILHNTVLASFFSGFWLFFLGSIFCIFQLHSTRCNAVHQPLSRWLYLLGFGLLSGISVGPLLDLVAYIDPSIPTSALIMTTLVFATFTMMALKSPSRSMLYLGGTLGSLMLVSITMGLLNLFVGSLFIFKLELMLGIGIFSGLIAYDTQVIIEKHRLGDADYLSHALDLFIDVVALFRRILVLLAEMKTSSSSSNERRNKRR
eukprot:m.110701 g.110701  ORF g.110701 m.110701 type:complete len:243 (+) comp15273_c0_seq2:608-1336(+)